MAPNHNKRKSSTMTTISLRYITYYNNRCNCRSLSVAPNIRIYLLTSCSAIWAG